MRFFSINHFFKENQSSDKSIEQIELERKITEQKDHVRYLKKQRQKLVNRYSYALYFPQIIPYTTLAPHQPSFQNPALTNKLDRVGRQLDLAQRRLAQLRQRKEDMLNNPKVEQPLTKGIKS